MDGWDWIGLDWILLRTLVQLEHLAVLKITRMGMYNLSGVEKVSVGGTSRCPVFSWTRLARPGH